MGDSLDARHGTSDEFYDPYCDSCYEDGGQNVRAYGFCKKCVQFLCTDCYSVHGRLQATRQHDVEHGEDMPRSQADKPPRFDCCDVHPKLLNDKFCCEHKILLCSVCSSAEHNGCPIKNVEDVCKIVNVSDTGALYDRIRSLQESLNSALPTVDEAIIKLKNQEKTMLHDAQKVYDQIIAQANIFYGSLKKEIQTGCQSQISVLSQQRKKISDMSLKLDAPLNSFGELKAKPIDTKLFLRLQENVMYSKKVASELQELRKSLKFVSMSFIPNRASQESFHSLLTLGKIQKTESNPPGTDILTQEIMFPVSALKKAIAQPKAGQTPCPQNPGGAVAKTLLSRPTQPLPKIKATKQDTHNNKLGDDKYNCDITGMAITNNKRILMTDNSNGKVKLFSHDMKFLSSVLVPDQPRDIAVISEREAAVTTDNKSLVILDISGRQLTIMTTAPLSYNVRGIGIYNNKLVVTSPDSDPPSVKLIDQTGRVYWSVSSDRQGKPLFREPLYVSSDGGGSSSTVIVTDQGNNTLTLLNVDTGEVITRRQLKGKCPKGVTTDSTGNVYVCYFWTDEVSVLSAELSEENILLSTKNGLSGKPEAIAFDHTTYQLIISYYPFVSNSYDEVDRFKLS